MPISNKASRELRARISSISFVILTLELALIRQIPAEVRAISYFTNLLLMATFFGLGLGCILQRARSLQWLVPLGLVLLAAFIYYGRGIVVYDEAATVHYWLQYEFPAGTAPTLPLSIAAVLAFVLTALPFIGLGQSLARAMDKHSRLAAYGWDIAGSLVGTGAFVLGSWLEFPPWAWTIAGAGLFAMVGFTRWWLRVICILSGALFLLFAYSTHPHHWSPYYFIQYKVEATGLRVWVNSSFHQLGLDFRSKDPRLVRMADSMAQKFGFPYQVYRNANDGKSPRRVLILGAGTGNDINVALKNGVEQIVAIEIDPVIVALGRKHNTSRPYQSRRVRVVVDDARHYLWNTRERFDLVIFGTLDSQTLLSGQANLRLENYVYTVESFRDVRRVLAPHGMFAAYYSVFKPWLVGRLVATAQDAFRGHLQLWQLRSPFLFDTLIMGGERIKSPPELTEYADRQLPATDDWPFLYLQGPTISPVYLWVMAVLAGLIVCAFLVLRHQHRVSGLHANFMLLGLGFTLMESAAIVRFALFFGSTWVTNALVFFAALATILLANWLVQRDSAPRLRLAWAGLFLFVAINYLVPIQLLFSLGFAPRALLLAILIGLPVFFAAVCFSRLFGEQPLTGSALGMNLVGAMGGGLLEYFSMLIGMKAIWLLALCVYMGAYLASSQVRRTSASE